MVCYNYIALYSFPSMKTHTHTHTYTHSQSTAINLPLPMKGKNFISVSVPLYLPLFKYLCFDISCYFKFYLYKYYLET